MGEYVTEIRYHKNQRLIFEDKARFKVIAKGRRFGLTKGLANFVVEKMLDGVTPILWVDTTYPNIQRYVERYFLPILKTLPVELWNYRQNISELRIVNSKCDFKSADKPENMEGFGYKLIILNEAGIILKNEKLWNETIRPMALDYSADVVIGGTPKGKRVKGGDKHLFFELFERGKSKKQNTEISRQNESEKNPPRPKERGTPPLEGTKRIVWKSFQFSSYDNPLLDRNEIDELAGEISPSLRDQEIYGKFIDVSAETIIRREWWRYYDGLDGKKILGIYQSWDTAFKKNEENDYSVCTSWIVTADGYYLTDVYRKRLEFPELKRKVAELYERDKPNYVLIEDKASGQSLIQELERETRIPIKKIVPDRDKVARVHAVTPLIESGRVWLPTSQGLVNGSLPTPLRFAKYPSEEGRFSSSVEMLVRECEEFPNGQYDDMVDSVSQFLNWVKRVSKGKGLMWTKKRKRKKYY